MQQLFTLLTTSPFIRMKNPNVVRSKLEAIIHGGRDKLHVITDFDMTLTKYWTAAGERNVSAHGVFNEYSKVSKLFKEKSDKLYQHYYPMELDPDMSNEVKAVHMVEWWQKIHSLIVSIHLSKNDVVEMAKESNIIFRAGVSEFISQCNDKQIPIVVFSAGIANVIEQLLKKERFWIPYMHIISNWMIFNQEGVNVAFSDPVIHILNKNEFTSLLLSHAFESSSAQVDSSKSAPCPDVLEGASQSDEKNLKDRDAVHSNLIKSRPNVLLLGDSPGDSNMADGLPHATCLRVAFLNRDIEDDDLERNYLSKFDIVLMKDMGMDVFVVKFLDLM